MNERSELVFRFYGELNDFLPESQRQRATLCACARDASLKHAIEALGVPHPEIALVLVDGEPVALSQAACDGARVAVYPRFFGLKLAPAMVASPPLPEPRRFLADGHLFALGRKLRMLGFDTVLPRSLDDALLAACAARERRILLTRDRELLKRAEVEFGRYVRAVRPQAQLRELVLAFDLATRARPFVRCMECNGDLRPVGAAAVRHRVPPGVAARYTRFVRCVACDRVYWQGSHYARMRDGLDAVLG